MGLAPFSFLKTYLLFMYLCVYVFMYFVYTSLSCSFKLSVYSRGTLISHHQLGLQMCAITHSVVLEIEPRASRKGGKHSTN